ncbi:hypothetical protein RF11_01778 [Thelohanellus kitauei]|uniref:Winged helix-turn helix domain-containing protein n=1 Tax=Thelohanellus kitauei TaxID=669202 RepID=A0A0C2MKJ7_THEKT|nr:hypothetical protein RF11_01778 [Thelohanellus kitauei]
MCKMVPRSKKRNYVPENKSRSRKFYTHRVRRNRNVNTSKGGEPRRKDLAEKIGDRFRELMNDDLTATLEEVKEKLEVDVTIKTIWKLVSNLGLVYKFARTIYEKRNTPEAKIAGRKYVDWYFSKNLSLLLINIIFIDKPHFNLPVIRNH